MILSGDRTNNAAVIRRYVISGNSTIPGASTVYFDEIAKDRIFKSIDKIKGMKTLIRDDVFLFITYHKEESKDEKNYVDGKPDYADVFEDNMTFKWDSKIGMDKDSAYMIDVITAQRKHFLVKKSDAESNFYYMGQFDIVEAKNATKEDNKGRMQPITKVTIRMHHPVREDLLRYLHWTYC